MLLGNRKQNRRSNRRQKSQTRNSTERRLQLLETLEDRRLLAVAGCFDEQLVRDESNRSVSPYHATDQVQVRQHRLHRRGLRLANPLLDNKTGIPNGDDDDKKPKIDNEKPESSDDKPAVPKDDTPTRKDDDQQAEQNGDKQEQPKTLEELEKERHEVMRKRNLLLRAFLRARFDSSGNFISPKQQRALLDSPLAKQVKELTEQLDDLNQKIDNLKPPAAADCQDEDKNEQEESSNLTPEEQQRKNDARKAAERSSCFKSAGGVADDMSVWDGIEEESPSEFLNRSEIRRLLGTPEQDEQKDTPGNGQDQHGDGDDEKKPNVDNGKAQELDDAGRGTEDSHSVTKQVGEEGTVTITSDRPISEALDKIRDEATRDFIAELLNSGEAASDSQPATEGVTLQVKITFTVTDPETQETIRITIDIRATGKPSDLVDKILTVVEESQRDRVRNLLTQFLNLDQLAETGTPLNEIKSNLLRFTCNQLICTGEDVNLEIEDLFVGPLDPPTESENTTPEEEPADSTRPNDSKNAQENQKKSKTPKKQGKSSKDSALSRDREDDSRRDRRGRRSRKTNPLVDNKTGSPNGDDEVKKPRIDNEKPESSDDKPAVPKDDTPTRKDDDQQAEQNGDKQEQPKTLEELEKERHEVMRKRNPLLRAFLRARFDSSGNLISPEQQRALLDSPLAKQVKELKEQLDDLNQKIDNLKPPAAADCQDEDKNEQEQSSNLTPEEQQRKNDARKAAERSSCFKSAGGVADDMSVWDGIEEESPSEFLNRSEIRRLLGIPEQDEQKDTPGNGQDQPDTETNQEAPKPTSEPADDDATTPKVKKESKTSENQGKSSKDSLGSRGREDDSRSARRGRRSRKTNPLVDNKTGSPNGDDEVKKPRIDNEKPETSDDKSQDKIDQPATGTDQDPDRIFDIPEHLFIDLPANRLTIADLFQTAPEQSDTMRETGLAAAGADGSKADNEAVDNQAKNTYSVLRDRQSRSTRNRQVQHSYQVKPLMEQVIDQVFATNNFCDDFSGVIDNNFAIAAAIAGNNNGGNQGQGNNQHQQEGKVKILFVQTVPSDEKPKGPPVPPCQSALELFELQARRDGDAEYHDSNGWTWVFYFVPDKEKAENNRGNNNMGDQEKGPAIQDNAAQEKAAPENAQPDNNQDKPADNNEDQPADEEDPGQKSPPAEDEDTSGDPATDVIDDQGENGQDNANGQQEDPQKIEDDISGLSSDEWEVRNDSTEALKSSTAAAIPYLVDTLEETHDREVRWRARVVLETLYQKLTDIHICNNRYINVKGKLPSHMIKDAIITVATKTPGQDHFEDQTHRAYEPITVSEDGSFTVRGNFNDGVSEPAEAIVIFVNGEEWLEVDPLQTTHPGADCDELSVDLGQRDRRRGR